MNQHTQLVVFYAVFLIPLATGFFLTRNANLHLCPLFTLAWSRVVKWQSVLITTGEQKLPVVFNCVFTGCFFTAACLAVFHNMFFCFFYNPVNTDWCAWHCVRVSASSHGCVPETNFVSVSLPPSRALTQFTERP